MLPKPFTLTLKHVKTLTPTVLHLGFTHAGEQPFNFIPGQFLTIHFTHDNKIVRRSYSVATISGQSDLIEIAASYVADGLASEYLFHLQPGDQIEVTGPFGRLVLTEEQTKRYLLIATGTGVTPYRSMLPELLVRLNKQSDLEVVILFGTRTRADLLYVDDFVAAAQQQPRLKFYACYSREFLEEGEDYEKQGYVSHVIKELNVNPQQDLVYLCGNPNMIDEIFAYLKEQQFASESIRREKYISPSAKK